MKTFKISILLLSSIFIFQSTNLMCKKPLHKMPTIEESRDEDILEDNIGEYKLINGKKRYITSTKTTPFRPVQPDDLLPKQSQPSQEPLPSLHKNIKREGPEPEYVMVNSQKRYITSQPKK